MIGTMVHVGTERRRSVVVIAYAAVALALWFVSSWVCIRFGDGDTWEVWVGPGGVRTVWGAYASPDTAFIKPFWYTAGIGIRRFCPVPWFYHWNVLGQRDLILPSWPVIVPLIVWRAAVRERHRTRTLAGRCRRCGYDLTGNVSGRCPECGVRIQSPTAAQP